MSAIDQRLLLVEDNPGDRRLFREMLRDLGYAGSTLAMAGSVGEALELLSAETFDVLFLDLDLPDSSGLSTLGQIQKAGHDLPVIVFTGLNDVTVGGLAVAHGAQDYLVKGEVHADVLARVIRYAVSRHGAIAAAKHEHARAAAAEARLEALQESRAALEHEVQERRAAQAGLERSLARLQAMRSIDRAIIANHTVAPMLQVVLHEGVTLLDVDGASIRLLDDEIQALIPVAQYGVPAIGLGDDRLPRDAPCVRQALHDGHATLDLDSAAADDLPRLGRLRLAGFRSCQLVALKARDTLLGTLELYSRGPWPSGSERDDFVGTLADQSVVAIESARLQHSLVLANRELVATYDATIDGWSHALDLRDRETEGHSRRVTNLTLHLARAFGVTEPEVGHLRRGALLHDIGKMGVPDTILQKAHPLDEQEWRVMRRHTTFARDLLEPIAYLRPAIDIPYAHHERWDGRGYPRGLLGDEIPMSARIFAVADVYDALTSDRPYRRAWSRERARRYVELESGTHFDPAVAEAFMDVHEGLPRLQ